MPGGILQIAAIGAQDVFLTGEPQITYFVAIYKRYTNFSIESVRQLFTGNVDFGKKVYCEIDRIGDLISDMYLYVKLPRLYSIDKNPAKDKPTLYKCYNGECIPSENGVSKEICEQGCKTSSCDTPSNDFDSRSESELIQETKTSSCGDEVYWVNSIGHALIKYIDIEIGQSIIDRHYGLWLEIWSELTVNKSKQDARNEMIGKYQNKKNKSTNKEIELFVPLQFWFCRNIGLALPLIALQYHEVRINLGIRDFDELWISNNPNVVPALERGENCCIDNFNSQHIKPKIRPIKIIECYLFVDYVFLADEERKRFANNEHEYLIEQLQISCNSLDASIHTKNDKMRKTAYGDTSMVNLKFNHPVKEFVWVVQNSLILELSTDNIGNDWFNFGDIPLKIKDDSIIQSDPMISGKFIIDGNDRMETRTSKYFRLVQPYQRHTNIPTDTFIYVYSFSLYPESHQPSGTFNFSCIDDLTFQITLNKDITRPVLQIFATNYNILRIMGGMAGISYSN